MLKEKFFLSICVISYNRPEGLKRLLESIDVKKYKGELQIVVCEDKAPRRLEVRKVAEDFESSGAYPIKYVENENNLGFSKNWREAAHQAEGKFLLYMGDDDMFVKDALDQYIEWLHKHEDLGYVLRTYQTLQADGSAITNRYYAKDKFYEAGEDAYNDFFLKSNFMSGYTIRRDYTYDFEDDAIDHTLYYQMYLQGEVCLRYPSAYCTIPITIYVGDGISGFGVNECEKDLYTPGIAPAMDFKNVLITFEVSELIDKKNGLNSTPKLKAEWAKYSSYPEMLRFRKIGISEFKQCKNWLVENGMNHSHYFNIYYYALLLLGAKNCQRIVHFIKKVHGGRPKL